MLQPCSAVASAQEIEILGKLVERGRFELPIRSPVFRNRPAILSVSLVVCQSALKIDPGSALNFDPARDDGSGAMVMQLDGSGPVFEAPALIAGLDDVAVMGQPVQQG